MLVDMHAHFPMQLLADSEQRTHERVQTWSRQRWEGEHMDEMARLQAELVSRYGEANAEKLCNANALRVLRAHWGRRRPRVDDDLSDTPGG